ncbi:unnamed protein product [Aspergillus oryzae]|uniref:Unnamed protein product n=2 Tax=Aspergillus oryzae TaxID=5062 RepID=A0AAN4YS57_ASPOZ|nr:unnamed protein product [Aspergillus oryzae]GMF86913.1 unnamed protein product [Aspergillus oryzae]GMG12822.1 unnamed protein product [Aspergillus oryzae]GMG35358.1 unnamed protein product [Aspergillus oryzae]GMG53002.1 unnamed protein product [Aspergillus oryzae var. brunneus]
MGESVSQVCHTKILKYECIPNDATVVTTRTTGKGAEAATVGRRRATTREGYGVLLMTQTRNGREQRGVKLGNAERAGFSYLMIDQLAAEGVESSSMNGFQSVFLGTKLAGVWDELSGGGEDASSGEGYHKKTSQGSTIPGAVATVPGNESPIPQ